MKSAEDVRLFIVNTFAKQILQQYLPQRHGYPQLTLPLADSIDAAPSHLHDLAELLAIRRGRIKKASLKSLHDTETIQGRLAA
jgi:hypothetical protein